MATASTGANVLRWSALGLGLLYGFSHQRTITSNDRIAEEKHAYEAREKLIQKAKAEFAIKNAPKSQLSPASREGGSSGWDLEQFLLTKVGEKS